jgi:L-fuconolactonase
LRIDAHHSYSERYQLAHLESILKRNGFEGSVLVSEDAGPPPCAFVRGVVVCARQPLRADAIDAFLARPWVRGILLRPRGGVPEGLENLERTGAPLDLEGGLDLVPEIASRFPALRLVLDHLGAPDGIADYEAWAAAIERAAAFPTVYCKLSGLLRLGVYTGHAVRRALALFGPSRLMFGSDWPSSLPDHIWKENLAAFTQAVGAQPIEVREELLGGTAARFYAL